LKPSDKDYLVEYGTDSGTMLRARTTWVSADENKDAINKEFTLNSKPDKEYYTFGRSNARDL
jgi:hypothetical protein